MCYEEDLTFVGIILMFRSFALKGRICWPRGNKFRIYRNKFGILDLFAYQTSDLKISQRRHLLL